MFQELSIIDKEQNCDIVPDGRKSNYRVFVIKNSDDFVSSDNRELIEIIKHQGAVGLHFAAFSFNCVACNACKPIRIDLEKFTPTRRQKKLLRNSEDLEFNFVKPEITKELYDLHELYAAERMASSHENFSNLSKYATQNDCIAVLSDRNKRIVAYTMLKLGADSVVGVTKYFDPSPQSQKRSLGVVMDLKLIEFGKQHGAKYFYLGAINLDSENIAHQGRYNSSEVFNTATESWVAIPRNPKPQDLEFNS